MYAFLIISFLCSLSLRYALKVDLDYSVNGVNYQPWCTATIDSPIDGGGMKRKAAFSTQTIGSDVKVSLGDLFYVQVNASKGIISNSIGIRNLIDAQWKIDVKFLLVDEEIYAIELRTAKAVPTNRDRNELVSLPSQIAIRGSVITSELTGVEIPAPKASKGIPHLGQQPITEEELIHRRSKGGAGSADAPGTVPSAGFTQSPSNEKEPSFFMKYWHLLLPGLFFFFLSGRDQMVKDSKKKN